MTTRAMWGMATVALLWLVPGYARAQAPDPDGQILLVAEGPADAVRAFRASVEAQSRLSLATMHDPHAAQVPRRLTVSFSEAGARLSYRDAWGRERWREVEASEEPIPARAATTAVALVRQAEADGWPWSLPTEVLDPFADARPAPRGPSDTVLREVIDPWARGVRAPEAPPPPRAPRSVEGDARTPLVETGARLGNPRP